MSRLLDTLSVISLKNSSLLTVMLPPLPSETLFWNRHKVLSNVADSNTLAKYGGYIVIGDNPGFLKKQLLADIIIVFSIGMHVAITALILAAREHSRKNG